MSSFPPILEFFHKIADALESQQGIKIYQHGFIGNPEGESGIISDPAPAIIKLYFLGSTMVATTDVFGDRDLGLREAAMKEIGQEFKTYYSCATRDLEEGKTPSSQEIAWNLAGALQSFRNMWPTIKKTEDKFSPQAGRTRAKALAECGLNSES